MCVILKATEGKGGGILPVSNTYPISNGQFPADQTTKVKLTTQLGYTLHCSILPVVHGGGSGPMRSMTIDAVTPKPKQVVKIHQIDFEQIGSTIDITLPNGEIMYLKLGD